jgi:hypothetical protein
MGLIEVMWPTALSAAFFFWLRWFSFNQIKQNKLCTSDKDSAGLADRVSGFVHALISSSFALYFMATGVAQTTLCTPQTNGFIHLSKFSAGFFVWDIWSSTIGAWGAAYVIHGLFSFTVYTIPFFFPYGQKYACGFLFFELSTVPFHMNKFVEIWLSKRNKGTDHSDHPAVIGLQIAFAVTFLGCRNVFGYYWSYLFQRQAWTEGPPDCAPEFMHYGILALNICFNVLNTFWASKIVSRLVKLATGAPRSKKTT